MTFEEFVTLLEKDRPATISAEMVEMVQPQLPSDLSQTIGGRQWLDMRVGELTYRREPVDADEWTLIWVPDTISDEFHRWNAEQVRRYSARLAAARERECRRLAEQKLRPRLRWLVDHPRLLGWVYRLVPSWRPTLRICQGSTADI